MPHRRRHAHSGALALSTALSASLALFAPCARAADPDLGPNVIVLDPSMSSAAVTDALDGINNEAQFDTGRHAVLFKPGTYDVDTTVGYYEQIAGLGAAPGDVTIDGGLRCEAPLDPGGQTDNATDDFWRSEENMTIAPTGGATRWAVSQGAPLRRMHVEGAISLAGALYGYASGGFIADSVFDGEVSPYSQQQWFTRNTVLSGGWSNAVWNMVFSGVAGAPAQSFPTPPYTTLATTPVSREKPFLTVDADDNWSVFAPTAQRNTAGASWNNGATPGRTIPIGDFLIATPSTAVDTINAALAAGQNLLLTPGIYPLTAAIHVTDPDTVVLGLGYATLVPQNGTAALTVDDVSGVQIAGLLIDAGPVNSPVLLQLGPENGGGASHASDPTTLNDVFFRIGGATAGAAITSLEVNSDDVILDDIWAWRADHGNGVGWTDNTAAHGLVVNGARVTALGLAVEHYQAEQVLWNGDAGETIFYQSELPYDVPSQNAWQDGGANGYPSYVVGSGVADHALYGAGVYSYFDQGVAIVDDNAITVPNAAGVAVHDATTVLLNGSGQISHVVDGEGPTASTSGQNEALQSYP